MSSDNDFVARLRIRWEEMGDMANDERAAAATEIESLRSGQREMMRTIAMLKVELEEARRTVTERRRERDEARGERDEARRELSAAKRELCRNEAIIRLQRNRVHRDSEDVVGLAKEIAVERGWDCFKENTND